MGRIGGALVGTRLVANDLPPIAPQVAVTYADGTQALLGTSPSSWAAFNADPVYRPTCCTSDPSWFLQPAENFDARLEPVGWREPGFNASGPLWVAATETVGWGDVPLQARATRPMAVTEGLVPQSVTQLGPGHIFIDLGREIQGGLLVEFPASATSGTQVREEACVPQCRTPRSQQAASSLRHPEGHRPPW